MSSKLPIRVMIVDDHLVVRQGLAAFLLAYDDLELAGEAGDGREAVECCGRCGPDVVLMDLALPEMDRIEAMRAILRRYPAVRVIMLTGFYDEQCVQQALAAGAIAYMFKNISANDLAAAIRRAAAGCPTLAPEATQALIRAVMQPHAQIETLTSREHDMLALMVKGLTNLDIARRLVVSRSTVKFHVSSILAKLGTASRTEAVALALQQRLA